MRPALLSPGCGTPRGAPSTRSEAAARERRCHAARHTRRVPLIVTSRDGRLRSAAGASRALPPRRTAPFCRAPHRFRDLAAPRRRLPRAARRRDARRGVGGSGVVASPAFGVLLPVLRRDSGRFQRWRCLPWMRRDAETEETARDGDDVPPWCGSAMPT